MPFRTKLELLDNLPDQITVSLVITKQILAKGSVGYSWCEKIHRVGKDGKEVTLQLSLNSVVPKSKELPAQ